MKIFFCYLFQLDELFNTTLNAADKDSDAVVSR